MKERHRVSKSETHIARTVILTADARLIPRSTLASGALITEDTDQFRALVAQPAVNGYVNLAGTYQLENLDQYDNVHFYAPLASLAGIREQILPVFARHSLEMEGKFVWLRRGKALSNAIDMALHLHELWEHYDQGQETSHAGHDRKPTPASTPLMRKAELLGRKIYPRLPKPLQISGLKAWYRVSRRSTR